MIRIIIIIVLTAAFAAGCSSSVEPPTGAGTAEQGPTQPAAVPRVFPELSTDPPLEIPGIAVPGPAPVEDVALDALQAAVDQNPSDATAHRQLAIALFRSGRRMEAVEHFERATESGPTVERLMDLAGAYGFAARLEDAQATYERVLATRPTHPTALYNLGNVMFMQGDTNRAIELYQRALEQQPRYMLAWFQLALGYKTRGDQARDDYRNSYKAFGKVLELDAANVDEARATDNALYEMAAMDVLMGAHERAEEMLRTLLEVNPDHPNAHYALAQLLIRQGRTEEGEAELAAHLEVRSKSRPSGQVATSQ